MSMASVRQSSMVWNTKGWSGICRSPTMFSKQAIWSGNRQATKSSACIRNKCGGVFLPPWKRRSAKAQTAFQRQRTLNIGAASRAWMSKSRTVLEFKNFATSSSGKLCEPLKDRITAFSVAAACNSKLKPRQKRLRSAKPQARFSRLPNGAWMMNCIPPDSSKKRSKTTVSKLGITPNAAWAAAR